MQRQSRPLAIVAAVLAILCIGAGVWRWNRRAAEERCRQHLVSVGRALANYESVWKSLPPAAAGGHSWRIRILPMVESSPVYAMYRFDEPWNSLANLSLNQTLLLAKGDGPRRRFAVPECYQCPSIQAGTSEIAFLMFVGENAAGDRDRGRKLSELTDGTANTLLAAESISRPVHWLEPIDFDVSTMSLKINDTAGFSISSKHPSGPAVLFADGATYRIAPDIPAHVLKALITINGGEDLQRRRLIEQGWLR